MGKKDGYTNESQFVKDFIGLFGASPKVCSIIWQLVLKNNQNDLPVGASPEHLLWGMLFMKTYSKEDVMVSIVNASRKTVRKWIWWAATQISSLANDVIKWRNRFQGNTPFRNKVTVDGTDFKIRQPKEYNKKWYSHKFNGPGLRYEVGVCISTGHIVWIHGPFPCGTNPDITIFRKGMKQAVNRGEEKVEADKGYRGEPLYISDALDFRNEVEKRAKQQARSRHEHINRYFKQFHCLKDTYRHHLDDHCKLFRSVAVITQISLQYNEKKVWQVRYEGRTFAECFFS